MDLFLFPVITIRTFFNSVDAGLARSLLESRGIQVYLHGENAFAVEPVPAFGIRIQVPESQADEARGILGGEDNAPLPDDFVLPPPQPSDETEHPKL